MKLLLLTRYGRQGASSRLRFLQYEPWLKDAGFECVVSPFFGDAMLSRKYLRGGYGLINLLLAYWRRVRSLQGSKSDLVWIEKEALPWFPAWLECWLLRRKPYVLDFDDAIFHNYDLHRMAWVRRIYGRRIDRLMEGATLVVAGNRYLADRAVAAGTHRVEIIPTVVDLERYKPKPEYAGSSKVRVVWIGTPYTIQYLRTLSGPLALLANRQPFTLRIIGGGEISIPGVEVEVFPWSSETEAALIAEADIGVMPLQDTPWEQGKCAYKLIQYMACGLPTVASPVGANRDVVIDGETGFLADTPSAWVETLETLIRDATLRKRMGRSGRARVETEYCLQQIAPRLVRLLTEARSR